MGVVGLTSQFGCGVHLVVAICFSCFYLFFSCAWATPARARTRADSSGVSAADLKKRAFEGKCNQLQLTTLILQCFDLQIKARMFGTSLFWESRVLLIRCVNLGTKPMQTCCIRQLGLD